MKDDQSRIPLTEYDPDKKAIIEPSEHIKNESPSPYCVMPIYGQLVKKMANEGKLKLFRDYPDPTLEGVRTYLLDYHGQTVVVVMPAIGASLVAAILEEMIAFGCRKFVCCGAAGVLTPELNRGHIIIPVRALRDEGTSYHYYKPSKFIEMDKGIVQKLEAVLQKNNVEYTTGTTWTTDAIYRETRGKVAKRRVEGCITVEMECAALLAVAKFRNVAFGQYLEAWDDVSGETWDKRHVENKLALQEKLFWLSVEACVSL
jgi:uridine phosphorylase